MKNTVNPCSRRKLFDAVGQLSDDSGDDDDDCDDENPDYNFVPLCNLIPKSTPPHSSNRPVNGGQVTPTAEQFSSSPKKVYFFS